MEDVERKDSGKKEIKKIVYFLALIWVLNIAILAYLFYLGLVSFQIAYILSFSPLVLIPFIMIGLWKFKKWGLFLGYILSIVFIIDAIVSVNIIRIILWIVVLYYLYKYRNIFLRGKGIDTKTLFIMAFVIAIFLIVVWFEGTTTTTTISEETTTTIPKEYSGWIIIDYVQCDKGSVFVRNIGDNIIGKGKITVEVDGEFKTNSEELAPNNITVFNFGHSILGEITVKSMNKESFTC